jgi:hypothetical protein|tara:strand:- start:21445 stop:21666 length:222 start_codon:yes stop_codon:yes gene_type:complete
VGFKPPAMAYQERIKTMILVRNIETGLTHTWDIDRVLEEINRDRSEEWQDYNETDWEEGWCEWVEGIDYERVH